jgi:hypothetical protein
MSDTLPRGIKVDCKKSRAEFLLDCLASGQPIGPSGEVSGWSGNDMLMLAGFCLFGAMSQGPEAWGPLVDPETYEQDMWGAANVYFRCAMAAADGQFEAQYGHQLLGVARAEGEVRTSLARVPKTTLQ